MLKRFFACILMIIMILNLTNSTKVNEKEYIITPKTDIIKPLMIDSKILSNSIDNNIKEDEYIPRITIKTEEIVEDYRYKITDKEFNEFVRIVEAEVTGEYPFGVTYEEAFNSKLRVAQVILNRVESPYFPNTVHDVIFQKNAFTPLNDGRYYEVEIRQVTIDACRAALLTYTKDMTNGCEFFSSGTKTCKYGSYVFTDEVGHSFFKSYRSD